MAQNVSSQNEAEILFGLPQTRPRAIFGAPDHPAARSKQSQYITIDDGQLGRLASNPSASRAGCAGAGRARGAISFRSRRPRRLPCLDRLGDPGCLARASRSRRRRVLRRRTAVVHADGRLRIARRGAPNRHRLRPLPGRPHSARRRSLRPRLVANDLRIPEARAGARGLGMNWSRRELLKSTVGASLLLSTGCVHGRPQARLLPSRAPLPKPFEAALPIIPVLKPIRTDASTDYYDVAQRRG